MSSNLCLIYEPSRYHAGKNSGASDKLRMEIEHPPAMLLQIRKL